MKWLLKKCSVTCVNLKSSWWILLFLLTKRMDSKFQNFYIPTGNDEIKTKKNFFVPNCRPTTFFSYPRKQQCFLQNRRCSRSCSCFVADLFVEILKKKILVFFNGELMVYSQVGPPHTRRSRCFWNDSNVLH